jgi:phosphatidylserine decarboxylase
MKKGLMVFIFKIIPTSLLSRLFGYLAGAKLPQSLLRPMIRWYCRSYDVNTAEFYYPPEGFSSFDSFFTRKLDEGIHKIDRASSAVVSPVDARVDQFGKINTSSILQAKGIDYTINELIPSDTSMEFTDGLFITLYLSPSDYHRIHSPAGGRIAGYFHIPGCLFTVQDFMVNGLKGLFTKNERLISYISTDHGLIAVCKIGAMNVGKISLTYDTVVTNKFIRGKREYFYYDNLRRPVKKGEEIGAFHLGSTIIMLFQKDMISFDRLKEGQKVRVGQRIGTFTS